MCFLCVMPSWLSKLPSVFLFLASLFRFDFAICPICDASIRDQPLCCWLFALFYNIQWKFQCQSNSECKIVGRWPLISSLWYLYDAKVHELPLNIRKVVPHVYQPVLSVLFCLNNPSHPQMLSCADVHPGPTQRRWSLLRAWRSGSWRHRTQDSQPRRSNSCLRSTRVSRQVALEQEVSRHRHVLGCARWVCGCVVGVLCVVCGCVVRGCAVRECVVWGCCYDCAHMCNSYFETDIALLATLFVYLFIVSFLTASKSEQLILKRLSSV